MFVQNIENNEISIRSVAYFDSSAFAIVILEIICSYVLVYSSCWETTFNNFVINYFFLMFTKRARVQNGTLKLMNRKKKTDNAMANNKGTKNKEWVTVTNSEKKFT